jgi:hypothetical protein
LYHQPAFGCYDVQNLFAVTSKPSLLQIETCDLRIRCQNLSAKTVFDRHLLPAVFTAVQNFGELDRNDCQPAVLSYIGGPIVR